jgi:hypothetical protein
MCPQKCNQKFSMCSGCEQASSCNRTTCTLPHTGEKAQLIGRRLVELELLGQKSISAAFYRLEARTGIGHRTWRDWWYGHRYDGVLIGTWDALLDAYEVALTTKVKRLKDELEQAKSLRR